MVLFEIANIIAHLLALMGILVITYAAVKSTYLFYTGLRGESVNLNRIRLEFGNGIILALEFIVAADIVESIAKPTYYDIGILASLVVIRTFLSYFLNKELEALSPEAKAKVQDISK